MKFSIIIPTLDEEDLIEELILKTRKLGNCEIIIVDGGSKDKTLEKATQADLVIQSDPGRAHQQNRGASQSHGEVLIFLHADCFLELGALEAIEKTLQDKNVIAGCFHQKIEADGLRYRLLEFGNALRVQLFKWMYGDQAIFVRREIFEELGRFPEIGLMEDLYLSKKLKKRGKLKILSPPVHISARRWKKNGVIRQTFKNWSMLFRVHCGQSPDQLSRYYPHVR
jgi:rSAM/selenodomain-associated transferase 2